MWIKHPFIQRIVSGWMLAVFLFAITPHQFVHEVISHHHDSVDFFHADTEVSIHHTHCDYLHLVHAPFTSISVSILNEVLFVHVVFQQPKAPFHALDRLFYTYLRGPPAC